MAFMSWSQSLWPHCCQPGFSTFLFLIQAQIALSGLPFDLNIASQRHTNYIFKLLFFAYLPDMPLTLKDWICPVYGVEEDTRFFLEIIFLEPLIWFKMMFLWQMFSPILYSWTYECSSTVWGGQFPFQLIYDSISETVLSTTVPAI